MFYRPTARNFRITMGCFIPIFSTVYRFFYSSWAGIMGGDFFGFLIRDVYCNGS